MTAFRPAASPAVLVALALVVAGCEPVREEVSVGNRVCEAPLIQAILPPALEETSGVAASRAYPGVFWSQNDSGGGAAVHAVDSTGAIVGSVRLRGISNRDWEDIAVGPCPGEGSCLFVGDIGDNSERHDHVAFYRVSEPDPVRDTVSGAVTTIRATYPGGPRDAEALFVTDAGIHVISKGRSGPIELFRLSTPLEGDEDERHAMERIQRLAPPPTSVSSQVTSAAIDRDHRRVVVRSYAGLSFYEVAGDTLRPLGRAADIVAPDQLQGEGVDWIGSDRLVLTSEAQGQQPPRFAIVRCDPTRPPTESGEGDSQQGDQSP